MARQPRFIEDDEPVATRVREPEADSDRDQNDNDNDNRYSREYDEYSGGGRGKKIALLIVVLLLGFAIVGAGVYALVHFVIMPNTEPEAVATEAPTLPAEPTLTPTPTQPPTEAPTEPPEPDYDALAETYMADMSDYDKLCQLFVVTPEVLTSSLDNSGGGAVTVAGDMTKQSLEKYPVGGIIYFSDNLENTEQTQKMISNSQDYAKTPLFIAVDEEGGDVARVADKLGTKKFEPMFTYKDKGADVAHDNAEVIASNLRGIGFNMDNAPVADVLSDPNNTVIGQRAYSDDYAQAGELIASAIQGFHDGGVITVLKHFPGHGATNDDSHDGSAYIETKVEDLKKNELQPFKAGIDAGADIVMVGHLVVSDLDPDMPASLSSKVVPELLRKELNYDGIVMTDSMSMGAIIYDYDTIVKGLFAADVDIILQPDNLDSYIEAIQSALENGDITQAQIDAKVKKILALKIKQGILKVSAEPTVTLTETSAETSTGTPADADASSAPSETANLAPTFIQPSAPDA